MNVTTFNDVPIHSKLYRQSKVDREDFDQIVENYKEAEIIRETNSTYTSPAFVVRKKVGMPRMVVNYRKLNKVTKPFQYPIPDFDELVEKLNGALVFATLYLACGYLLYLLFYFLAFIKAG